MGESGMVVGIEGDNALVEMEASKECEACGACRYTETGRMVASVSNSLSARVGDTVKIDIEPKLVLAAAALIYIMPIVFFFVGYGLLAWIASSLGADSEAVAIAGGLTFLVLSFLAVRAIDRQAGVTRRFEPKMYDIIRKTSTGGKN